MKKIAVLCKEGFEEIEALTPVDILRRAGVHVDLVGMDHGCFTVNVKFYRSYK